MAGDAYFSSVTALISLDGAGDGATSFTDQFGNTITCTNGTHISTSNTHFGKPTIALTGAGNGRVQLSPANALDLSGVSNSTVEFWFYPTSSVSTGTAIINSATNTGGTGGFFLILNSSNQLALYFREYYAIAYGAACVNINDWNHIAVSFVGTTAYLGCNGTIVGSGTVSSGATGLGGSDYAALVGTVYNDQTPSGYLGQARITKGVARYTASYTVPTEAFSPSASALSGTVLNASGAPAARTVLAYRRDTGALIGSTTSNGSTGAYSIASTYSGEHDLVCLDSTGTLPDLVLSRVTPV